MPRHPKSWRTVALIAVPSAVAAGTFASLALGASPAHHLAAAPAHSVPASTSTTTTTVAPTTVPTTTPTVTVPRRVRKKTPRRSRVRATFTIYPPLPGGSSTTTAPPATAPATAPTTAPTTTTTIPPTTTTVGGFVAGQVTAVGDSVMLDYATPLRKDVGGISIDAAVGRQWDAGEKILSQLKSEGRLGATVVVALGTNGPITSADFDHMMSILAGATRVVFVNLVVDQPWQGPNNAVLAEGVSDHPNTVLANWASLEAAHRNWMAADGTHLPIDGPGAVALAALIASKV